MTEGTQVLLSSDLFAITEPLGAFELDKAITEKKLLLQGTTSFYSLLLFDRVFHMWDM